MPRLQRDIEFTENVIEILSWILYNNSMETQVHKKLSSLTPCYWWLRSALSYGSSGVGVVLSDGLVYYNRAYNNYGALLVCTIDL